MSSPAEMPFPPESAEAPGAIRSRLTLDLFTSYLLTAARVGSNVAIFAILYRYTNERYAATYALIRAMLMPLTYLFGGFNPVLQRLLFAPTAMLGKQPVSTAPTEPLPYATGRYLQRGTPDEAAINYAQTNAVVLSFAVAVLVVLYGYSNAASDIHEFAITRTWQADSFVWLFGIGFILRLIAEPASAVLQSRGQLWLDNVISIGGEVAFVVLALRFIRWGNAATFFDDWLLLASNPNGTLFLGVADAFLVSGIGVCLFRTLAARIQLGFDLRPLFIFRRATLITIASGAALVSLGQFADFLYAPANILLINTFIHPSAVASYAPALQFDAGLLLLVGAVSTVMLPRAALAWARGDRALLRAAYVRASLACLFVLAGTALFVGTFVEPILRLWLGTVPENAPAITRLVLFHTVIGGAAGVGRAVLLGMGRFKAYTLSALLGGVANVGLALVFVLALDWGIKGIALATIVSVTLRCAVWMPWYILRSLRNPEIEGHSAPT